MIQRFHAKVFIPYKGMDDFEVYVEGWYRSTRASVWDPPEEDWTIDYVRLETGDELIGGAADAWVEEYAEDALTSDLVDFE